MTKRGDVGIVNIGGVYWAAFATKRVVLEHSRPKAASAAYMVSLGIPATVGVNNTNPSRSQQGDVGIVGFGHNGHRGDQRYTILASLGIVPFEAWAQV